jgi:taurine--2-oxoglutarate transaminase
MTALETRPSAAKLDDRAHVFHSWSAQGLIDPIVVAGAEGSWFWDEDGRRYLDLASQLMNVNLGHQHPRLVAAIQEQAGRLCTIAPSFANDARSEAARLITELAPGDLDMVFFTNGGADANEHATRSPCPASCTSGVLMRTGRRSTPRPRPRSASARSPTSGTC